MRKTTYQVLILKVSFEKFVLELVLNAFTFSDFKVQNQEDVE